VGCHEGLLNTTSADRRPEGASGDPEATGHGSSSLFLFLDWTQLGVVRVQRPGSVRRWGWSGLSTLAGQFASAQALILLSAESLPLDWAESVPLCPWSSKRVWVISATDYRRARSLPLEANTGRCNPTTRTVPETGPMAGIAQVVRELPFVSSEFCHVLREVFKKK
jgi:hypothetical protein